MKAGQQCLPIFSLPEKVTLLFRFKINRLLALSFEHRTSMEA